MTSPEALRVGVLLPSSKRLPGLDRHFLAALRGALGEAGIAADLAIEPTGTSAVQDVVVDKVQRVLLQHDPHLVTGVLGAGTTPLVQALFRDAGVPCLVNDLGGDPLLRGPGAEPWLFWNSFDVWRSMYALGYWAARTLGSRAAVVAGFHEAGYGIVAAFWQGFAEGGGEVIATQVTHVDSSDQDPSAQVRQVVALAPDTVVGMYSGREGVSFLRAWRDAGGSGDIPLVVSPFTVHPPWLEAMGDDAVGLRTAASWDGRVPEGPDGGFLETLGDGPPAAHPFGLLGWESGRIIADALARLDGAAPAGPALRSALGRVEITSPRGRRHMDPDSGDMSTTDRLMEVRTGEDGRPALAPLEVLDVPQGYAEAREQFTRQERKSGWVNPYLVI